VRLALPRDDLESSGGDARRHVPRRDLSEHVLFVERRNQIRVLHVAVGEDVAHGQHGDLDAARVRAQHVAVYLGTDGQHHSHLLPSHRRAEGILVIDTGLLKVAKDDGPRAL
jgi:hypothetical protein